jgi:hypothetical protein
MSPPPDIYRRLLHPLNTTGLPYFVTGGLAAILYGEPRLTNDVDVVLQLEASQASRLIATFPAQEYYVPPIEVLRDEAGRPEGGHFNILHLESALRADIYCLGTEDALGNWALTRRRRLAVAGEEIAVAPIEYVILRKLQYHLMGGGDRHVRDIQAMLRLSSDQVDRLELTRWLDHLGLNAEWYRATGTNP